jgi:hypothetical protein
MAFNFKFTEIRFNSLKTQVEEYVTSLYKKAGQMFSAGSPYGQILQVVEMIYQLLMTYLKNTVNQFDLSSPDNQNDRTIRTLAVISGHSPVRAQSASGTLRLQVRPAIDIEEEIQGSKITFFNRSRIRNKTNNLEYFLDLGKDFVSYDVEPGSSLFLPIIQGVIQTQTFTATGEPNQSYSVVLPPFQSVEQNIFQVKVDGNTWTKRGHLYDILPEERAYSARTGFNGGLEIWFGNGNFGQIPQTGDEIEVTYIISNGEDGNLPNNLTDDFTYIDEVYDKFGNLVDVESNFFTFIENEISFGSDTESVEFTKSIMPYISRNFVLAKPEQFIFVLKRLNIFTQINAYTTEKGTQFDNKNPLDDSIVYLFLVPDFTRYIVGNTSNYFNVDINAFYLDDTEKQKIVTYLNTQGIVGVGIGVKIIQPVISRYVLNISLITFDDVENDSVRGQVLEALSDYFIDLQRRDRIPKSDLIRVIENVDGVDSVSVRIVSQKNEEYHRQYEEYKTSIMLSDPTANPDNIIMEDYDPDLVLGLDKDLNDILIDKDELALIRGGWHDRYGTFYDQVPKKQGLGSVNFIFKSRTKRTINV